MVGDERDDTAAEIKQVLTHLALGLMRQDDAVRKGLAPPVTQLDEQLQGGWDDLTRLCHLHGVSPPRHLPHLVTWLHQPVETWNILGAFAEQAGLSGPLLSFGIPSEQCEMLSRDMHLAFDIERELQDVPFKEILFYCLKHHLVDQYREARSFLIHHPFLPEGGIAIASNSLWDTTVRKWLRLCYEPVPRICWKQSGERAVITCCSRCGWPLEWRFQNVRLAHCYSDLCSRLVKDFHDPGIWHDVSPDSLRTTRGIQASVVAPELPLLDLVHRIEQELRLIYELWPEVDHYDLRIHLSGGEYWAVDMKDHLSPKYLAAHATAFEAIPQWDRAFFVFPDYRHRPGYFPSFQAVWRQPPRTQAFFANEFFHYLRAYEKKEAIYA